MEAVYAVMLIVAASGIWQLPVAQDSRAGKGGEQKALDRLFEDTPPPAQIEKPNDGKERNTAAQKAVRPIPAETQKMMLSLITDLKKCWVVPVAARSVIDQPVIVVRFGLDRQGKVLGEPSFRRGEGRAELQKPLFDSAVKAILTCQPYRIARQFPQFYDLWKEIHVRFDPREM